MAIACKICIMTKGIRGSDKDSFFKTQEELNDHLEKVHHMPVQQDGETREECVRRFIEKYPEARTCPDCIASGAEWTKNGANFSKDSDRKIAEMQYSPEYLRKMDEATFRMEAKDSPSSGPTGVCPCGGALVYLHKQGVHYCALCDTEYPDNNGVPVVRGGL